jgi:hypothetical protein
MVHTQGDDFFSSLITDRERSEQRYLSPTEIPSYLSRLLDVDVSVAVACVPFKPVMMGLGTGLYHEGLSPLAI